VITLPRLSSPLLLIKLKVVVAGTPFTELVRVIVFVVLALIRVFDEMTDDVATTPLTVVVRVLPERVCVNEFIIFITAEDIPFIIFVNVLVLVATVLLVMILVVAKEPPRLEVSTFAILDKIFVVNKFATERFVAVALVSVARAMVAVAKLPPLPLLSNAHSNCLVILL
jgi:hypothetical protein